MALAASAPVTAAEIVAKKTTTFEGRDRTYYLYVPDDSRPQHPLIVLLHGTGGNGLFMLQRWKDVAAHEGLLLLAPDSLHADLGWNLRVDGPNYIHGLITDVSAQYPVDPQRIYLFGQSGGAVHSLVLGMLESEYFAAVAIHGGAFREPVEFNALNYATRKIPISISIGDEDEYFSTVAVHNTQQAFTDSGFPFELNVLKGRKHSYLDVPADFNEGIWSFFNRNALPQSSRYATYGYSDEGGQP